MIMQVNKRLPFGVSDNRNSKRIFSRWNNKFISWNSHFIIKIQIFNKKNLITVVLFLGNIQ